MSFPGELQDWDRASQSVSLELDEEVSDAEPNFQDFEDDVYDMGINQDLERGAEVPAMNFSPEFEYSNAERSPSPAVPTDGDMPYTAWPMRTPSPAPSYESMESEEESNDQAAKSSKEPVQTATRVQLGEPDSPASSCYSFNSDNSTELVRKKPRSQAQTHIGQKGPRLIAEQAETYGPELEALLAPNEKRHPAITMPFVFKSLQATLQKLALEELTLFKWNLTRRYPQFFKTPVEECDVINLVDNMLEKCDVDGSLRITMQTLKDMKLKGAADYLKELINRNEAQFDLKLSLKRKYECIFEGVAKQGQQTVLRNVFTELYVTEGGSGGINKDHEVRRIESPKRVKQEVVVRNNDFFSAKSIEQYHIRSVLSKGVAGMGKSVCVQQFILDWAEDRDYQHFYFVFPMPFRELNLMHSGPYSLMQLIHNFFPEMKELQTLDCDECKVLFICDGLEESTLPLDFRLNECWCDMTQPTTLDKLMTNLVKGNLLPSAHIWITSRPFQTSRIPAESIHKLVEVRGFSEEQKEEYIKKRFPEHQEHANILVAHVKSVQTLNIMCHNPLFCWITATVLDRMIREAGGKDLPKSLTRFFVHFMVIQLNMMKQKYHRKLKEKDELDKEYLLKLGKLAFRMLEKGQEVLSESEWRENDVNFEETVVYSGLCTEVYKEEFVMYHTKMYCFVHLSVQEYLAAFYVFLSFKTQNKNVLDSHLVTKLSKVFKEQSLLDLHRCAVDKALQSEKGHLDLFLRFLLGLSMESNQNILRGLLAPTRTSSQVVEETEHYIKDKIRKNQKLATCRKLSLCLEELKV